MTEWQLGFKAFREGRLREAVDRLRAAADEHERTVALPVRFQTLCTLGAALYALGQPADAVPVFQAALRLSPSPVPPPELTLNLANACLATGMREEARAALEQTLRSTPGHLEARLLLDRLNQQPIEAAPSGAVLGESPEQVKNYLRTLTFGTVAQSGYDPAQVREALTQVSHYIDVLTAELASRDETIRRYEGELERFYQMEDQLVANLLKEQELRPAS